MAHKSHILLLLVMAGLQLSFFTHRKPSKIVIFGDSITQAAVFPGGFIAQMRDSLEAGGKQKQYELIGAGVGGDKVYDLYLRLETDVLARKPKTVVIYVGVNDVWHKQLQGTGTDMDKFRRFYAALLQKLLNKGIRVILCTPACIGERRAGGNPLDAEMDAYSGIIRQLALERELPLCDLRKAFLDYLSQNNPHDLDRSILTTDGVHLNEKGNKIVAEMLLESI